jgi:hypothetical protein
MATDPISYDKADLRGIVKAFKAMDDQAVHKPKAYQMAWPLTLQSKDHLSGIKHPKSR